MYYHTKWRLKSTNLLLRQFGMASTFYYFGFGSNMLSQRIHLQNPTAKRVGVGQLDGYRLEFYSSSKIWLGAPATIVPACNSHVYGAIWEIDQSNLKDMDEQLGVARGRYKPLDLCLLCLATNENIMCRVYQLALQGNQDLRKLDSECIPYDRQPSQTYLKVLIKGALETGIPENYVEWLRSLKHNGYTVPEFEKLFNLSQVQLR